MCHRNSGSRCVNDEPKTRSCDKTTENLLQEYTLLIHVLASNIGTYVPVQILYFLSNQMIFFSNSFNDPISKKKKRIILIDTQVFNKVIINNYNL